jgi:hypothetical protein
LRAVVPILTLAAWALALAAAAQTPAPDSAHPAAAAQPHSPSTGTRPTGSSPARTPSAERYKAQHGLHGNTASHNRYTDYRMGTKSGHRGARVCSEQAGHKVCEWR